MNKEVVTMNWPGGLIGLFLWGVFCWTAAAESRSPTPTVELTGTLIPGGVECQLFQADTGERYTLVGDIKGFKNGDRIRLSGEMVAVSICMQAKTISVKKIEEIKTSVPNIH
jgi:hypothetical protein